MSLLDLKLIKCHLVIGSQRLLLLVSDLVLAGSLFQLTKSKGDLTDVLVLTTFGGVEEVDPGWLLNVIARQV